VSRLNIAEDLFVKKLKIDGIWKKKVIVLIYTFLWLMASAQQQLLYGWFLLPLSIALVWFLLIFLIWRPESSFEIAYLLYN
jgi:hypothetical protein